MAIKATIYKALVQVANMDLNIYRDHSVMIARHPSETDERMLIRLLAFALNAPANDDQGPLEFAKDMWDPDEPALWQRDLTGRIEHWIEVGQPDEKRLLRISAKASRVTIYSFGLSTRVWWSGVATKVTRARNLTIWQVPSDQSQALAALAQRSMQLQVTVQDEGIWVGDGTRSVEIIPVRLFGPASS